MAEFIPSTAATQLNFGSNSGGTMTTVKARLTIKRLHPLFVGEVTGIDLTQPIPREDFRTIWDAFNEHQILVFRDQAFDDESQIAFSRNFGELETMIAHPGNDWNPGHISVMTNLGKDGNLLPLDHPAMIHRERNEAWHSDSSFKPVAALASLLAARIVPPVGGNTEFASARAAYEALSAERKAGLEGLTAVHRITHPDMNVDDDKGYDEDAKQRHTVTHPLIRTNPVNGRKALYVGSHAQEIVGMPLKEGRKILDELTAFCTQPQFVYSHHWRDGDAVMWDNRCTLHRATSFDKTRYKRKLHRTTIAGKSPDSAFARMPEPRVA
jgi:alpha-ketoglutarate-dependent 2,4-dichlorophenoxyacetate dioxygenase